MKKILIIGAGGQIGSELTMRLRSVYGNENVVATDMRDCPMLAANGPFVQLNALDGEAYAEVVKKYKIDAIYNLVALLSAVGEANPQKAWQINMGALMNSLEIAREYNCALFTPSSIGAFGPNSPKVKTPQDTVMRPTTIYGVCKVTGELLGDYYHKRFGVDKMCIRDRPSVFRLRGGRVCPSGSYRSGERAAYFVPYPPVVGIICGFPAGSVLRRGFPAPKVAISGILSNFVYLSGGACTMVLFSLRGEERHAKAWFTRRFIIINYIL